MGIKIPKQLLALLRICVTLGQEASALECMVLPGCENVRCLTYCKRLVQAGPGFRISCMP